MVVFGTSKSNSSGSTNNSLFEQPLEKLCNLNAIKQLSEIISSQQENQISQATSKIQIVDDGKLQLCTSLSTPLTSCSLSTWAKLSKENNPIKRKRAAARLRRYTIDANNNNLTISPVSAPQTPTIIQHSNSLLAQVGTSTNDNEVYLVSPLKRKNYNSSLEDEQDDEIFHLDRQLMLRCLPEPIECLLRELYLRGPSTLGIFRKSPNAKHCKELRQKLEQLQQQQQQASSTAQQTNAATTTTTAATTTGQSSPYAAAIEQFQVNVIASVFKVSTI